MNQIIKYLDEAMEHMRNEYGGMGKEAIYLAEDLIQKDSTLSDEKKKYYLETLLTARSLTRVDHNESRMKIDEVKRDIIKSF